MIVLSFSEHIDLLETGRVTVCGVIVVDECIVLFFLIGKMVHALSC